MLIELDTSSLTPLYSQLVAALRQAIATGDVSSGEKLPTAAELAGSLDLNKNTVLRAYRQLRDDGWVELRRGRGAIVVTRPDQNSYVEQALDELATAAHSSQVSLHELIAGLTVRGVK